MHCICVCVYSAPKYTCKTDHDQNHDHHNCTNLNEYQARLSDTQTGARHIRSKTKIMNDMHLRRSNWCCACSLCVPTDSMNNCCRMTVCEFLACWLDNLNTCTTIAMRAHMLLPVTPKAPSKNRTFLPFLCESCDAHTIAQLSDRSSKSARAQGD